MCVFCSPAVGSASPGAAAASAKVWTEFSPRGDGRLLCIFWSVRRRVTVTSLVVAAVGVIAALAVADALRSRSSTPATAPPTATRPVPPAPLPDTTVPSLTPAQRIERIGNTWAPLFAAARPRACNYMTQPACERVACERVGSGPIPNCTLPSSKFRRSFEDATVQDVSVKGYRAAARFSNGELVEFFGDGGTWWIQKLGGNAGREFFE